jgi:hypothetical protein
VVPQRVLEVLLQVLVALLLVVPRLEVLRQVAQQQVVLLLVVLVQEVLPLVEVLLVESQ